MNRKKVTVNAKEIHNVHEEVLGTLTGLLQYVFQGLALENKLCSYLQRIGSNNSVPIYTEKCTFTSCTIPTCPAFSMKTRFSFSQHIKYNF